MMGAKISDHYKDSMIMEYSILWYLKWFIGYWGSRNSLL